MGVVEVNSEHGQVFGGPEQHLGIALLLERLRLSWVVRSLSEGDLEQTLGGGELSCDEVLGNCVHADWICVESYDDGVCGDIGCTVPVTGAVSRRPGPVPLSADDLELAELRLRWTGMDLRL